MQNKDSAVVGIKTFYSGGSNNDLDVDVALTEFMVEVKTFLKQFTFGEEIIRMVWFPAQKRTYVPAGMLKGAPVDPRLVVDQMIKEGFYTQEAATKLLEGPSFQAEFFQYCLKMTQYNQDMELLVNSDAVHVGKACTSMLMGIMRVLKGSPLAQAKEIEGEDLTPQDKVVKLLKALLDTQSEDLQLLQKYSEMFVLPAQVTFSPQDYIIWLRRVLTRRNSLAEVFHHKALTNFELLTQVLENYDGIHEEFTAKVKVINDIAGMFGFVVDGVRVEAKTSRNVVKEGRIQQERSKVNGMLATKLQGVLKLGGAESAELAKTLVNLIGDLGMTHNTLNHSKYSDGVDLKVVEDELMEVYHKVRSASSNVKDFDARVTDVMAKCYYTRFDKTSKIPHAAISKTVKPKGAGVCFRCGRPGHKRSDCHAATDSTGQALEKKEGHNTSKGRKAERKEGRNTPRHPQRDVSQFAPDCCTKCGSTEHKPTQCPETAKICFTCGSHDHLKARCPSGTAPDSSADGGKSVTFGAGVGGGIRYMGPLEDAVYTGKEGDPHAVGNCFLNHGGSMDGGKTKVIPTQFLMEDSGGGPVVFYDKAWIRDYISCNSMCNGIGSTQIAGVGSTIAMLTDVNGVERKFRFARTAHLPQLDRNILGTATWRGMKGLHLDTFNELSAPVLRLNGLFADKEEVMIPLVSVTTEPLYRWFTGRVAVDSDLEQDDWEWLKGQKLANLAYVKSLQQRSLYHFRQQVNANPFAPLLDLDEEDVPVGTGGELSDK